MIRACGRAHARKAGDAIAYEAINDLAATGRTDSKSRKKRPIAGLPQGQYRSEKGKRIFQHIAETEQQMGVRLFLIGGTLLGHVRDNALLPWDKDVDFGCFAEDAGVSDLWEMFFEESVLHSDGYSGGPADQALARYGRSRVTRSSDNVRPRKSTGLFYYRLVRKRPSLIVHYASHAEAA